MKKALSIFFLLHLLVIMALSITSIVEAFISFHHKKKANIPILTSFKNVIYSRKYLHNFLILSGTNTGYGFYGISVSTEKFLEIELYDSSKKLIKADIYFNFNTVNGFSRFKSYASHLSNYINDTEEMIKTDTLPQSKANIAFREKYIEKVFKYLGNSIAKGTPNCHSYKVKLNTVVPINVWSKEKQENPKKYVIKEIEFNSI
jgi:hypothetical protein